MRFNNRWKLYEFVDKNPGTLVEISNKMNLSIKKTKRGLSRLIKDGMVIKEGVLYRSKTVKEMIDWDEMNTKPEDYNFERDDIKCQKI